MPFSARGDCNKGFFDCKQDPRGEAPPRGCFAPFYRSDRPKRGQRGGTQYQSSAVYTAIPT